MSTIPIRPKPNVDGGEESMSHLRTLFSSASFKAWVAGLCVAVSAYLIPAISNWLNTLTPEAVMTFFGKYGVQVEYGIATLVIGLLSTVFVYITKNRK